MQQSSEDTKQHGATQEQLRGLQDKTSAEHNVPLGGALSLTESSILNSII